MSSSLALRIFRCDPAEPGPPWSSTSMYSAVSQPKCSRVLATTVVLLITGAAVVLPRMPVTRWTMPVVLKNVLL
ncbi:hypothetical protein NESM_000845700 [Novymonas esmeraldas]|uniref:Uncharacterized protein n=1 Tax=Novymonas esmeraldas TaxID=1808958 RepID=A0AAW0EZ80_9TRYP